MAANKYNFSLATMAYCFCALLKVFLASDLSDPTVVPTIPDGVLDKYEPCTIDPKHGYTLVYEVELPTNHTGADQLSIEMCSKGGYDQARLPCQHQHQHLHQHQHQHRHQQWCHE
jgi:hypothetical protein